MAGFLLECVAGFVGIRKKGINGNGIFQFRAIKSPSLNAGEFEIGAPKIRTCKVGVREQREAKIRLAQKCSFQMRPFEDRELKVRHG